jgi:hypothetical protein
MPISELEKAELNAMCPRAAQTGLGDIIQALQLDAVLADANVDDSTIYITPGGLIAVKPGGLVAADLAADAVETAKILNANVTAAKLASDAVTTVKILDAQVTAAKLAADAVITAKILDANVTHGKLAADAVQADKIASGAVGAAALAADVAITIRHRVTAAEVNSGHTLVTPPTGRAVRLVDVALIAIGGGAAGATTVDILDGATKLVAAAVGALTQSALLRAGAANATILADGASFVALATDHAITIGKTGASLTGAADIDVLLTYAFV